MDDSDADSEGFVELPGDGVLPDRWILTPILILTLILILLDRRIKYLEMEPASPERTSRYLESKPHHVLPEYVATLREQIAEKRK